MGFQEELRASKRLRTNNIKNLDAAPWILRQLQVMVPHGKVVVLKEETKVLFLKATKYLRFVCTLISNRLISLAIDN